MAENVHDGKQRADDDVEGPNQQQRAETRGGRLRTPSRKTGGGKLPHAPAEMSEADPLANRDCHRGLKLPGAAKSPGDGERGFIRRHLRRNTPRVL